MSENENFTVEQTAEAVVEQEVAVKTENKKKFTVLGIVALATLGVAFILGIVGICIAWLSTKISVKQSALSGADTLNDLLLANKAASGQFFNGLEAIQAFAIIAIISAGIAAITFVIDKLVNVKALKYVTAGMAALLIVSSILALLLTFTCTNTEICKALKDNLDAKFTPAAGAWLLSIFGVIGGVFGIIGALDDEGVKSKEYLRKQAVNLKRKPQKIAFLFLAIVTIYNLLTLTKFSNAIITYAQGVDWVGLLVFVNTLLSILILVAFLNAFPKLKKHNSKIVVTMTESGVKLNVNILMAIVVVIMAGAMIACEAIYYNIMHSYCLEKFSGEITAELKPAEKLLTSTLPLSIAHIVLLSVFLLLLLTLPLYRKLIMKINTSVKLESAASNIKEIDLED